ncbi:class I SAM-dependent methyltransferase [Methylobacillus arboreus]|uniref:class I SAM-dependent methyltransferase n=1 Tax=Methylobacillus arboreus TaxID=755170 RepID=UPI001E5F3789|nr:class I SAM-dependent methyltransferase [Methylobacillus arboreus]MCB5189970.1 class I SAM-dependent methyltransferase [Methylobacillus arboreus]
MNNELISTANFRELIQGMRNAFSRGENVMEYARKFTGADINMEIATLIAYDLQAGSYIKGTLANPDDKDIWCAQLAELLTPLVDSKTSLMEVGCGEATTIAGVLGHLKSKPICTLGFDISWSRCHMGNGWLSQKGQSATLFVADIFNIPLEDNSVDVVYTSHSIEPNGGREQEAITELWRVARKAVVLVEPVFELASEEAKQRMIKHGYVRNLKLAAERLPSPITEYRLLDYSSNRLNPSGVIVLDKQGLSESGEIKWRCPITFNKLSNEQDVFVAQESGFVYPVLRGIPLLRTDHAVVASRLMD